MNIMEQDWCINELCFFMLIISHQVLNTWFDIIYQVSFALQFYGTILCISTNNPIYLSVFWRPFVVFLFVIISFFFDEGSFLFLCFYWLFLFLFWFYVILFDLVFSNLVFFSFLVANLFVRRTIFPKFFPVFWKFFLFWFVRLADLGIS